MSIEGLGRPDRPEAPTTSIEGPAGSFLATIACDHLEQLAMIKGDVLYRGAAYAFLSVTPQDLDKSAPLITETDPLIKLPGASCTLYVEAVNDDELKRRQSTLILIAEADVSTNDGKLGHEVSATQFFIDPNPDLEPDPATRRPPQNVIRTRAAWTQENPYEVTDPVALVTKALPLLRAHRIRTPAEEAATKRLGTAHEIGDIVRLAHALQA